MHRLSALLVLSACTTTEPAPAPALDAPPPCDLVSCAAGAAFECCELATYSGSQTIAASLARSPDQSPTFVGGGWLWSQLGALVYPVSLPVGCRITSFSARVQKVSGASFSAGLVSGTDGAQQAVSPAADLGAAPAGFHTLTGESDFTIGPDADTGVRLARAGSPLLVQDRSFWASIRYECPVPGVAK